MQRNLFISLIFLLLLLVTPAMGASAEQLKAANAVFSPLLDWLGSQGVERQQVTKWLNANQVKFEGKLLSSMLSHREVTRDYQGFFSTNHLQRARQFQTKYANILKQTQESTSVPSGVIVAIILVESDLGGNTGKSYAFNMLASQAVLDTKAARDALARTWPASQKDYLSSQAALDRFAKRAEWARGELLALIRLCNSWKVSPLTIKSSAAGALGWCQFMPTSIERWGADGSGDSKVDVNNPLDAIASIGRYLQEHGWQDGMSKEQQIQVLLTYNKSTPYAEAILGIAEKL